jgi:hypothetical protein
MSKEIKGGKMKTGGVNTAKQSPRPTKAPGGQPKKTQLKLYSIMLSGQGDTNIAIVGEDCWDYIVNGVLADSLRKIVEERSAVYNAERPAAFNAPGYAVKELERNADKGDNDRALCVISYYDTMWSIKDYTKYIVSNKIEIEDDYEGYIY